MDNIAKRSDKIAFFEISGEENRFLRMRGFTEFSINKNPVEYSRKYIDEKTQRSDVVGYAPSIDYSFDRFSDNPVHKEIIGITDNETVGMDAVRKILIADMSSPGEEKEAILREWTVIPDSEGDESDTYTYSGTLKANGEIIKGTVTSDDDWQSVIFTQNA